MTAELLTDLLDAAVQARETLLDAPHETGLRLYNGFAEGEPRLVVDLYGRTLVVCNYADPPEDGAAIAYQAQMFFVERLPWLQSVVLKVRNSPSTDLRRGILAFGTQVARHINENGVRYALDLRLNRDSSFYLDTRELRAWAKASLSGKTVLNTFAYTGSLGVAALAGGALRVVHLDRNRNCLSIARQSYTLNGFPIARQDFVVGDFWPATSRMRRADERFDCIFLDPPFFARSAKGTVDQNHASARLINKVRPLIKEDGYLVAINNALFVSGHDYLAVLDGVCSSGYLAVERLMLVPDDVTGFPGTRVTQPIVDPVPFNHSTKIAILRVHRKHAVASL
jgi:23S rRNA (cytosine1962-C5)-methyltransferase